MGFVESLYRRRPINLSINHIAVLQWEQTHPPLQTAKHLQATSQLPRKSGTRTHYSPLKRMVAHVRCGHTRSKEDHSRFVLRSSDEAPLNADASTGSNLAVVLIWNVESKAGTVFRTKRPVEEDGEYLEKDECSDRGHNSKVTISQSFQQRKKSCNGDR